MKKFWMYLAIALLVGCGSDGTTDNNDVPIIDVGTPDAGSAGDTGRVADMPESTDSAEPDNSETPRDDLDFVIEREIEFANGESGRVVFEVPDDAVSVTVSIVGDPGSSYTLAEWENGDGTDLVARGWLDSDQGAPAQCVACPVRVTAMPAAFTAVAPNNRKTTLAAGPHSVRAYGFTQQSLFQVSPLASGTATLRVIIKRLPAEPDTGVLDINFHLTGAKGWTSETVADDEEFRALLDDLRDIYAQVGVELGVITYTDIPEEYRVIEVGLTDQLDLQELWALSSNQPRNAINVFIVEELTSALGAPLGVSGGIPGPPLAGTPRSGVVVGTTPLPPSPEIDFEIPISHVMAHEVGHHLGLYHTTEQFGQGHDPIDDTPQNDDSLLMYFAGPGQTLSPTQGEVMRRSVWVNHGGGQ